jgi:hypothetical protein
MGTSYLPVPVPDSEGEEGFVVHDRTLPSEIAPDPVRTR